MGNWKQWWGGLTPEKKAEHLKFKSQYKKEKLLNEAEEVKEARLSRRRHRDNQRVAKEATDVEKQEKKKLQRAEKYLRNKEKHQADCKARYWRNREVNLIRCREHYQKNKVRYKRYAMARQGKLVGTYTDADIDGLRARQKGKCMGCKNKLGRDQEVDHVMPLSRGGLDHIDNLQILCRSCNRRKGRKTSERWAQEHGKLFA